jgi:hypothetical protein
LRNNSSCRRRNSAAASFKLFPYLG